MARSRANGRARAPEQDRPRTLADVAKALNVDPSTVSLALSGSPKISESTRSRVLSYCEKVNFQPNHFARWLSRGRTGLVGVVFPSIESSFFPQILEGIEETLDKAGLFTLLAVSHYDVATLRREILGLLSKRVEGLLIVPLGVPGERDAILPLVKGLRVIWLLHPPEGLPFDVCVRVNNELGGFVGTKHLIEHGHERIAFLGGPPESRVAKLRKNGWQRALLEAGLEPSDRLCAGDNFTTEAGVKAVNVLCRLAEPPTAFMASSDYSALGAIDALIRKKRIPGEDAAVVGFDDICCGRFSPIPLTTVCQPKFELGRAAANVLLEVLDGKNPEMPMLAPTLTIRRSCGCAGKDLHP